MVSPLAVRACGCPWPTGLVVPADQPRLGDADRGQAGDHAEMRGDAEAARVGDALAVDHQQVGLPVQHRQGRERGRDLAERQVARNVGKAGRQGGQRALHQLEALAVEQGDRSPGEPGGLGDVDVDAGDQARRGQSPSATTWPRSRSWARASGIVVGQSAGSAVHAGAGPRRPGAVADDPRLVARDVARVPQVEPRIRGAARAPSQKARRAATSRRHLWARPRRLERSTPRRAASPPPCVVR